MNYYFNEIDNEMKIYMEAIYQWYNKHGQKFELNLSIFSGTFHKATSTVLQIYQALLRCTFCASSLFIFFMLNLWSPNSNRLFMERHYL